MCDAELLLASGAGCSVEPPEPLSPQPVRATATHIAVNIENRLFISLLLRVYTCRNHVTGNALSPQSPNVITYGDRENRESGAIPEILTKPEAPTGAAALLTRNSRDANDFSPEW
jgi:hypothetical protein